MRRLLAMKVGPAAMPGQSRDVYLSVRSSGRLPMKGSRVGGVLTRPVMNETAVGAAVERNGRR